MMSEAEIAQLESEGWVVLTEDQYNSMTEFDPKTWYHVIIEEADAT